MHDFVITSRKRRDVSAGRGLRLARMKRTEKKRRKGEKSARRESDNRGNGGGGWSSREEKKTAGPVTRKAP